jgi:two-component system, NarL family, response regulator NreC
MGKCKAWWNIAAGPLHAIQQVSCGMFYLSPGVSRAVIEAYRTKSERPADPLIGRKRQVLQLIAEGKSTKDIASLLDTGVKTSRITSIKTHAETGYPRTASLVRYAVRRGLVQP